MKISMWMLFDAISDCVMDHNLDDSSTNCTLFGVLPYTPSQAISSTHAYLISVAEINKASNLCDSGLIIYGTGETIEPDCPYIRLREDIELLDALALLLSVVERYNRWFERLQQELCGVPDLNRLCSIGRELLDNPLMLFDPNHVLAASSGLTDPILSTMFEDRDNSSHVLSDSAYKALVSRPEHEDDAQPGRISLLVRPLGSSSILYANILSGVLEYRLCINDTARPFRKSDFQLCAILSEAFSTALSADYSRESSSKSLLCGLLKELISGVRPEAQLPVAILTACGWQPDDPFVCLGVEKANTRLKFESNDIYVCSRLEELLGDACAFMDNGRIICVVHLSPSLSAADIYPRIEALMHGNIFIVGASDVFSDIAGLENYCSEACLAIKNGRIEKPGEFYHRFSDYAFTQLFQFGFSGLPPICFCDENVRLLTEMNDSRVDYCETLRTYIENDRNLLRTAELLHIHRTTLFYRLNRIREAINADLDDPNVRLRMWISFRLMDIERRKHAASGTANA